MMKTLKTTTAILCLFSAVALLGACESARKAFSSDKTAPDEFAVYSRPPLSLPPEYKLRPPTPGKELQRGEAATVLAKRAITSQAVRQPVQPLPAQGSPGVQALLRDTGGLNATSAIRATINEESSILSNQDQRFVDKLIFWVDENEPGGTIVDAKNEQKRIQNNQALGKAITDGESPEIKLKRNKKGLLDF
ncbi:MAG: DUF3035 domain-containing protein [Proteobacteria bacterium]|nr:DUF3035 domain-containing protein [Pseudomonadota bacterium]